jgi:hypothetical protein
MRRLNVDRRANGSGAKLLPLLLVGRLLEQQLLAGVRLFV